MLKTASYFIAALTGYLVGRFGHTYLNVWLGNPGWAPHHWIYGLVLIIIGLIFYKKSWGLLTLFFGLGLLLSDFKDFWQLKFFTPDVEGAKRFWRID